MDLKQLREQLADIRHTLFAGAIREWTISDLPDGTRGIVGPDGSWGELTAHNPKGQTIFRFRADPEKPFVLGMHWHPYDEKIVMIEGSIRIEIPNQTAVTLKSSDELFIPPYTPHVTYGEPGAILDVIFGPGAVCLES